ncbi:Zn-dependent protease with chaperone function [Chryseobacterium taichungense]|uniref:Zn-dependent protease with chaperone function n=1 Tax=Chryseobacterium taichungense TaxID=295069 RepID=A0A1H7XQX0_9FLAO|nr:M48 family metallopeptidase [Chryseobacterium taichungense]SEM36024.1 Zn-dependent protease with chaperone function [Chryseobacterium taichungense]
MTNNLPPISRAYQSKLISAIVSILVFFTVYFVLILISLGLIFLLGYAAVKIIALHANYLTVLLALGLFSVGLVVFYFLIKFIFIKNNYSTRHLIEVNRKNQPELFAIIDEIVAETKVKMPGKVFFSPEVNASVSYNSLFWSMFLPVKKNLTIGIGLVNSCTVGELKSVLAHEFGHFSQRSMKIGGYVNQAEKIIFDTVYNNNDYEQTIKHGSGHWAFQLTGMISVGFINAFKYILKFFSDFIFKNNASLRREMEFHADAVATYVTNPEEQISSLLRLELSSTAFESAFSFYTQSEGKYLPENLFDNQTALMKVFSERNNHVYENDLPKITEDELTRFNRTKLEIEDQWASHPETTRRIEMIRKNETKNRPKNNNLAKNIIRGFDEIGKALTSKYLTLYEVKNVGETIHNNELFAELYKKKYPLHMMSIYNNGYYERHNPVLENIEGLQITSEVSSEKLFSDAMVSLVYEKTGLENDLSILKEIVANPKVVKTFKYDGVLYPSKDARILTSRLTKKLEEMKLALSDNDKQIFSYYYSLATDADKEILKNTYLTFASINREYDMYENVLNHFAEGLAFMTVTLPVEEIRKKRSILLKKEKAFKDVLKKFNEESSYKDFLTSENKKLIIDFIDSEYIYFNHDKYIMKEVESLFSFVGEYRNLLNKAYIFSKEQLIGFQVKLEKSVNRLPENGKFWQEDLYHQY